MAVDDDVDDHAASERVCADIIDSSRLVEGENAMSFKCLFCGHSDEEQSASDALPRYSWCAPEAKDSQEPEVVALKTL